MTDNIRDMFSKMNDDTRSQAIKCIKSEFNITSSSRIRNAWLIGGRIPTEHQESIVKMFQILLRKQDLGIRENASKISKYLKIFQKHIDV